MLKYIQIYHIDRTVYESEYEPFGDGSHIIYVNGRYKDESSALGKLMHDFQTPDPDDMYYKEIAERVRAYKEDNGGGNMLSVFDEIEMEAKEAGWAAGIAEGRAAGIAEGRAEGIAEGRINGAIEAFRDMGLSDEKIIERITQKYSLTIEEAKAVIVNKTTA